VVAHPTSHDRGAIIRTRWTSLTAAAAASLVLAACGTDEPDEPAPDPDPIEDPGDAPDDPDDGSGDGLEDGEDTEEPAPPPEDDDGAAEDEDAAPAPDDGTEEAGAAPLAADETTERSEREAVDAQLTVTDVRVGTHDGFDRVVVELVGDGEVGWFVEYVDEATSQGSGLPVDVDGEAFLSVAIHGVLLPPDAPEDHELWAEERIAGPPGGIVTEVVDDTIFEAIHLLFVGLDDEVPYRIERFEDPQRVVIDLVHDG
jgi:hypothetical protein